MKLDATDLTIVLDRSGSMSRVREAAQEAVNGFVESQKTGPGTCRVTAVLFDDKYEVAVDNVPVGECPTIELNPRGGTALLDAIGKAIATTGERLKGISEPDRPATVMFVIQTDGCENASREYDSRKIHEMISHQRDTYNWEFVFLGANQDAIATAATFGIPRTSAMTFAHNAAGNRSAYASVTKSAHKLRSARSAGDIRASYAVDESDRDATENAV